MSACVHELRIFSADPVLVLRAQGRALLLTGLYLLLALPSMVVLGPIIGAVVSRAALRHEYRPLRVGEEALVSLSLDGATVRPRVTTNSGLTVLPPLVMVDGEGHVRLRAASPGEHRLTVFLGQAEAHKTVQVGTDHAPVSPYRARAGDPLTMLTLEPALPERGAVARIKVDYPTREPLWPGAPWWIHLFVISMVAALALRNRLGVVF